MSDPLFERWKRFLTTFFGAGNELDLANAGAPLSSFIAANERSLERDEPGPFILPCRQASSTIYFAIALSDGQAQDLRRVLAGVIGPTYTNFDGRTTEPELGDQVLASAVALAGSPRRVFQFKVPESQAQHMAKVRSQCLEVLSLFEQRPTRAVNSVIPFGRLVRNLELAISNGERAKAESILFGPIKTSGQLSGANLLFLHIRLLAGFEAWEELDALPALEDAIRMRRPALVSDALAKFALQGLSGEAAKTESDFEQFCDLIAPRFSALVPTAESIRSEIGAEYYVLWNLSTGVAVSEVASQLDGLRWVEVDRIARYLNSTSNVAAEEPKVSSEDRLLEAYRLGQVDRVLDELGRIEPSVRLVPILVSVLPPVVTTRAYDLVTRFRVALGADVFDEATAAVDAALDLQLPPQQSGPLTWRDRLIAVAAGSLSPEQFERDVSEGDVLDLLRSGSELRQLAETLEGLVDHGQVAAAVDGVLTLLDRLEEASNDPKRLRPLQDAVITVWALTDNSGDRTRADQIISRVDSYLAAGNSTSEYQALVNGLRENWGPLLTDRAFELNLRAIEVLLASRPGEDPGIIAFAAPIFGRLSPESVRRFDPTDLLVAQSIARELGLALNERVLDSQAEGTYWKLTAPSNFTVGFYSLDEGATRRASEILLTQFPGITVDESHSKVSTDELKNLARSVDLMVVAVASAKHAATGAIGAERGDKPLVKAAGKGSSSLVRAVFEYLESVSDSQIA